MTSPIRTSQYLLSFFGMLYQVSSHLLSILPLLTSFNSTTVVYLLILFSYWPSSLFLSFYFALYNFQQQIHPLNLIGDLPHFPPVRSVCIPKSYRTLADKGMFISKLVVHSSTATSPLTSKTFFAYFLVNLVLLIVLILYLPSISSIKSSIVTLSFRSAILIYDYCHMCPLF